MTDNHHPESIELMRAFRQLGRVQWHNSTVAGLKPSEVSLLFRIRRRGESADLKVTEISAMMHVTSPTVTQLVNGLEARGLLERTKDPADGRIVRVKLSAEGERISRTAEREFLSGMEGVIDHLGADRSQQLIGLLDEVYHYYEAKASVRPACPPDLATKSGSANPSNEGESNS